MSGPNSARTNKKLGKALPGGLPFGALSGNFGGPVTPPPSASTPTPGSNLNPKDLYYQQVILNSISALQQPPQQQQQQPPQQQQQPPQQQETSSQMHAQLAQLQLQCQLQQCLSLPSSAPLGYQQMLTQQMLAQQLVQLKMSKQHVTQQLLQLQQVKTPQGEGGGTGSPQQQQQVLQTRLNLINQFIGHINQQLLLQKYSGQSKEKVGGGGMADSCKHSPSAGLSSPQIGQHTPPSRNKDCSKLPGPFTARSVSLPGGSNEHSLSLGMQGLSVNGHPLPPSSISQSSARSVSRLQQIISGSSSTENLQGLTTSDDKAQPRFRNPPGKLLAASSESFGASGSSPASMISSTTSTPASTPFAPARSFNEIQEFRPGVPWQPRAMPTEPAQVYASPSLPHPTSVPDMRALVSEPYPHFPGPGQPFPLGGPGGRPPRRPPSHNTSYFNAGSGLPPGGHKSRGVPNEKQQGWHSKSVPGPKGYLPARSSISSPMTGSQFGGGSTPDAFSPNHSPFGPRPKQHPLPQYRPDTGLGLARPQALFSGPHPFPTPPLGPPTSVSPDVGGQWGLGGGFPGHTSTSITSSVWNSSSGKPWNRRTTARPDERVSVVYPSTSPAPADSTPQFTSPPGQPSVSTANRASNRLAVSLSSAWEKQGLHNVAHPVLSPKSTFAEWQVGKKAHPVLSPEPTFAEWQAGKKAHLSVFKLPSNPPSEWLLIKNVSSQVRNDNYYSGSYKFCYNYKL